MKNSFSLRKICSIKMHRCRCSVEIISWKKPQDYDVQLYDMLRWDVQNPPGYEYPSLHWCKCHCWWLSGVFLQLLKSTKPRSSPIAIFIGLKIISHLGLFRCGFALVERYEHFGCSRYYWLVHWYSSFWFTNCYLYITSNYHDILLKKLQNYL